MTTSPEASEGVSTPPTYLAPVLTGIWPIWTRILYLLGKEHCYDHDGPRPIDHAGRIAKFGNLLSAFIDQKSKQQPLFRSIDDNVCGKFAKAFDARALYCDPEDVGESIRSILMSILSNLPDHQYNDLYRSTFIQRLICAYSFINEHLLGIGIVERKTRCLFWAGIGIESISLSELYFEVFDSHVVTHCPGIHMEAKGESVSIGLHVSYSEALEKIKRHCRLRIEIHNDRVDIKLSCCLVDSCRVCALPPSGNEEIEFSEADIELMAASLRGSKSDTLKHHMSSSARSRRIRAIVAKLNAICDRHHIFKTSCFEVRGERGKGKGIVPKIENGDPDYVDFVVSNS